MTSLGDKFKEAAKKSVAKYSIGTYSYKFGSSVYDPDTGAVSRAPTSKDVPAARYNITKDKRDQMSYTDDTCIVVIAGLELGDVVPQIGGIVVFPDLTKHRVVWVEPDQYGAAYFLHVTVKTVGS